MKVPTKFGPNVMRFTLTQVNRRWYFMEAYIPPGEMEDYNKVDRTLIGLSDGSHKNVHSKDVRQQEGRNDIVNVPPRP